MKCQLHLSLPEMRKETGPTPLRSHHAFFRSQHLKKLVYSVLMFVSLLCSAQAQSTNILAPPVRISESSLSQVRELLKLAESQQPLWADYVARIDEYSKEFYQERPVSALSGDAAPRQIGRLIDNMQNRLAVLDEIERSAKALYAVLDTGQKQTADQLLLSTIPVFASSANAACSPANEGKPRGERPEGAQHKRRGGGMGGIGGMGQ
jgi:hypothetical protein